MKAFTFIRPRSCKDAAQALAEREGAVLKSGGVDLLDRMKERVSEPDALVGLVDVEGAGEIRVEDDGAISIGARATLAQLAASDVCLRFLPTLAEAAGLAASPQIRNQATIAGNIAQHTRCGYYRHKSFPCLKRGDKECPVKKDGGVQDTAGVFDTPCVSAHPSSLAPVLGSLGAEVHVRTGETAAWVPFRLIWKAPDQPGASDLKLDPSAVIESVRLPARDEKQYTGYYEVRQKAAFDWALVSCAVRYELDAEQKIRDARVWFGSVAATPFHAVSAENALVGERCTEEAAEAAAAAAFAKAKPLPGAAYKLKLGRVALKRALAAARGRS